MNRSALKAPAPRGGGVSEKGSALHITTVHRRLARASPRGSYRRVVRAWPFTNSVEFVQHVFDYLLRCLVSRRQQQLFEFLLAPKVAVTVLCLRDSIGVRHHNVIGFELERSRRELRVRRNSHGDAAGGFQVEHLGRAITCANYKGRIVARVYIVQG